MKFFMMYKSNFDYTSSYVPRPGVLLCASYLQIILLLLLFNFQCQFPFKFQYYNMIKGSIDIFSHSNQCYLEAHDNIKLKI